MKTASQLVRDCGYVTLLRNLPPRTQREREARARRDEAAARGTTFHAAIEAWVNTGTPGQVEDPEIQGWIDLLASQWAPPPGTVVEEVWGLSPSGMWVHTFEPEPHAYRSWTGEPLLTAGRADANWMAGDVYYVVDWKTGRWPVTPAARNLQVNAASIALATAHMARAYVPGIYYVRDGVFDWGEPVDVKGVLGIWTDIRDAAQLDETPRPGPHCSNCWERRACAHAEVAA